MTHFMTVVYNSLCGIVEHLTWRHTMKHTAKIRMLVITVCVFIPLYLMLHSVIVLADGNYTYTDPETGIVYYSPDEPGGVYSWDLPLADYRQTIFEETWENGAPPPTISADLNADGYLDLVFAVGREEFDDRTGDLSRSADLVYGVGDGTGHFHTLITLAEGVEQYLFAVGDIDHDDTGCCCSAERERSAPVSASSSPTATRWNVHSKHPHGYT
jgi:hypothetical protein